MGSPLLWVSPQKYKCAVVYRILFITDHVDQTTNYQTDLKKEIILRIYENRQRYLLSLNQNKNKTLLVSFIKKGNGIFLKFYNVFVNGNPTKRTEPSLTHSVP
jgi:hypothetical protein